MLENLKSDVTIISRGISLTLEQRYMRNNLGCCYLYILEYKVILIYYYLIIIVITIIIILSATDFRSGITNFNKNN